MKRGVLTILVGVLISATVRGEPFNLATFNIRCPADRGERSWAKRAPRCIKLVEMEHVEMMGVQEATPGQVSDLLKGLPGWAAVGCGRERDRGGESCSILYRKERFELLGHETFWLSENPDQPGLRSWGSAYPRICTRARFRDRRGGAVFHYFNTHLDHVSPLARQKGMALILSRIREIPGNIPLILGGDMNAETRSPSAYKEGEGERIDPISLATALLDDSAKCSLTPHQGPLATYTGYRPTGGAMIDYLFVSKGIKIHSHKTCNTRFDGLCASDHDPVIIRVSF